MRFEFTKARRKEANSLWPLVLSILLMLASCGGNNSTSQPSGAQLAGNWQFAMSAPSDNSFLGGIQGGFFLYKNNSITGGVVYAVQLPAQSGGLPTLCNGGAAPVTGTVSGQNVTLTVVASPQ